MTNRTTIRVCILFIAQPNAYLFGLSISDRDWTAAILSGAAMVMLLGLFAIIRDDRR